MQVTVIALVVSLAATIPAFGQQPAPSEPPSIQEKWHLFESETFNPLTLVAGAFNASVAQATNIDPRYGVNGAAYAQRFGASTAGIVTQNLFEDFVFASAFHEDTCYIRGGPESGFWPRFGHAFGSAFVVRKDAGGTTFNWANAAGSAASTGVSYAYYPPGSRTESAMTIHFAATFVGAGLGNLAPEFGPDVHRWFKRHL